MHVTVAPTNKREGAALHGEPRGAAEKRARIGLLDMAATFCGAPAQLMQPAQPALSAQAPSGGSAVAPQPMSERRAGSASAAASQGMHDDLLTHWRQREVMMTPSGIFANQQEVNRLMRAVLIEWMLEVTQEFRFVSETFLLAVNYLDRYMSKRVVTRWGFQLLGITCLWIAAKYEEVYGPTLQEMVEMTDSMYTKQAMNELERDVLHVLGFELSFPTAQRFLSYYCHQAEITSGSVVRFAEALLELAVLEPNCTEMRPSHVAAAALCTALSATSRHCQLPAVIKMSRWEDHAALANLSQELYKAFTALCRPGVRPSPVVQRFMQQQQQHKVAVQRLSEAPAPARHAPLMAHPVH